MRRGVNNSPQKNNCNSALIIAGWDLRKLSLRHTLLAAVTISLLFVALWARVVPQRVDWSVGQEATRTIVASRSTVYVNREQTEELRQEAADQVELVFRPDAGARQEVETALNNIFSQADKVRQDSSLVQTIDKVQALQRGLAHQFRNQTLRLLVDSPPATLDIVEEAVREVVGRTMREPIRNRGDDLQQVQHRLGTEVQQSNLTPEYQAVVTEIAQAVIKPNRIYDDEETQRQQDTARNAVPDIESTIHTGDVVIKAGEPVILRHIDMFRALGLMNPAINYTQALGMLLLLALVVLTLWTFTSRFYPAIYLSFWQLFLLSVVVIVAAIVFRISQHSAYFEAISLMTACAGCMLVALTTGAPIASATAPVLGLLIGLVAPGSDVRLVVVTIICSLVASYVITIRGSWSQTIARAAAVLAVTNSVLLLAGSEAFGLNTSWQLIVAAAAGGVAAALLAVGATMVAERPLGLLTDLQLMELLNPSQPILRRLLREAPGTYQHSIMVGNLADQAAEAIGANALLARTAAMYHDIGKLKRPYFFVENQFGHENPHDKLTPQMSALVIVAHAKDGIEMAEQLGLPPAISSAIPQHHGTALIEYFYDRALEEAKEDEEVSEQTFRYPGPKPQTRENAILMLADIVEAAARTLDEPSPTKICGLVDALVEENVQDGQLDESPLTYADVNEIKRSFVATLTSVFHERIKYPDQLREEAEQVAQRYQPSLPAIQLPEPTSSPSEPPASNGDQPAP